VLANNVPAEVAFMQFVPMSGMYQLVGFVNGVQQFSYHSQFRVTAQPRLFKDNDPPGMTGEESAGAVSRVRFYADGLTPADVTDIYNASVLGNPSSCPAASASATGKPKATKAGGSVLIDTGIQGTCPDTGVDCNGTASVAGVGAKKSKASVLSSASFTVPSGKTQEVIFRLRKRGKKLLRERGKLKVTASVSLTGPNGKPVTVQTRGKLRYPGKRH
jgi:hypothetical protein